MSLPTTEALGLSSVLGRAQGPWGESSDIPGQSLPLCPSEDGPRTEGHFFLERGAPSVRQRQTPEVCVLGVVCGPLLPPAPPGGHSSATPSCLHVAV